MAILTKGLKLSKLSSMPDEQRSKALSALCQEAINPTLDQLQAQIDQIDCEIRHYESKYIMSSADMKRKLANGGIQESADICSWLMLLKIRDDYYCRH